MGSREIFLLLTGVKMQPKQYINMEKNTVHTKYWDILTSSVDIDW